MLLNGSPLAVEGVVGRALEAFGANAGSPAAGGLVAESGERGRGARGGAEAEHNCDCAVDCLERRVEGWRGRSLTGSSLALRLEVRRGRFRAPSGLASC